MPSISIQSPVRVDLQAILDGIAKLDTPSLEKFASTVNTLVAHRKTPHLSKQETDLLQKINRGMPVGVLARFDQLQVQQKQKGLSSPEQKELHRLVESIEATEAERLGHLIALASIRQVSLDELRKQLHIKPPVPHAW